MNEKHQEAITQDQAGDFTALNHIERVIAELKGLKPMLEDEAMALEIQDRQQHPVAYRSLHRIRVGDALPGM